jgi:putative membrane protein
MITIALMVACAAAGGALVSALISWLPALHVYNVLGLMMMALYALPGHGAAVPSELILPFMIGLVVGWAMLNTVPSVLLGAPDEGAIFTVLPGQKYLMLGRGHEGVMMTGIGALAGTVFLVLVMGPLAPKLLPIIRGVMKPHMHWVLWVIIVFILMSEWPKGGTLGPEGWHRFLDAWRGLAAGLLTFFLSGLLGFILLNRPPVDPDVAFQNILPAFVGLFAVPWCILNIMSAVNPPPQKMATSLAVNGDVILRGTIAGGLGGGFAASFPVITAGIGGLLAGHATAQRDERVFIISQGVSKQVYYVGAFMLFFVPGLHAARGGGAMMLRTFHTAGSYYEYFMALASIAIAGAVAFLMLGPMTKLVIKFIEKFNYRSASWLALLICLAMVVGITGWTGLAVMLVATGIGLLPVLFGSRRLNCLGILLLPFACNMSGLGPAIAHFLKLM